jgi:hypothetical protein
MKLINQQTCFTVHSSFEGYAALGIGTTGMAGSDMYIGYANTTNGVTVANMRSAGTTTPRPIGQVTSIPLLEPRPSFAKLSFSFCKSNANTKSYIYAMESSKPTGSINTANAGIVFHTGPYGSFTVDLAQDTGTVTPTTSSTGGSILKPTGGFTLERVYQIHGILMFLAWCVSPFIGIFIARHLKSALGHNWFRLHVFFMGFGSGLLTILGFILIFLYKTPPHFDAKETIKKSHVLMGLIITIVTIIQIILGIVSDKMFDEKRSEIPIWDKLHWWVGRLVFLGGIVNCYLGILVMDTSFPMGMVPKIVFFVVIGLGFGSMIFGQTRYGQDNHVQDNQASQSTL